MIGADFQKGNTTDDDRRIAFPATKLDRFHRFQTFVRRQVESRRWILYWRDLRESQAYDDRLEAWSECPTPAIDPV